MKSHTDIEQSKKLAKILSIESADMWWSRCTITDFGDGELKVSYAVEPCNISQFRNTKEDIPCWSLAVLLEEIPEVINFDNDESDYTLEILKEGDFYYLSYGNPLEHNKIEIEPQENFVDACVELILKLHELKML